MTEKNIRKVLVSEGFGAGWATWSEPSEELATDAELIRLVEQNLHLGDGVRRDPKDPDGDYEQASVAFVQRAREIVAEKGEGSLYFGGVKGLIVEVVSGPFQFNEYDGFESLLQRNDVNWL